MPEEPSPKGPGPRFPPPHLWEVDEANARLPGLRELLPQLRAWAARLAEVHAELGRLVRFWGDELASRDHPDHGLSGRLEAEWRNLTHRLDEAVTSLRQEGIEVKQLESGLVDFYAALGGEPVLLCWRLDEPEVGYYHSLEGGFAGRRPLPARRPPLSPDAHGSH